MPQTLPQLGQVIAGKYRIDRELGTGGMGAVFQVTHRVTGKRFALKWLLPQISSHGDAAQRFIREAQVAGRFEHPNVVEVYDVGAEDDSFYMVMELLEGESLAARVERAGPLSVAEACRLLIPCMHGVAEAHAAGIVHRDLKPANLFICAETKTTPEHAKVLDFGISKMSGTPDDLAAMTRSGTLVGTPHYMPLEQMRGRPVDHRVDIYAFGVVLYQVLSGRLPYPADSFSDLVLAVAHETPRPLDQIVPRLPRGLSQVVARAMARDAENRHPDLPALIAELEYFADMGASESLPPPSGRVPSLSIPTPLSTESQAFGRAEPHGSGLRWMFAGALTVAIIVVATALWWRHRDSLPPIAATPDRREQGGETPQAEQPKAASPGLERADAPVRTSEPEPVTLEPVQVPVPAPEPPPAQAPEPAQEAELARDAPREPVIVDPPPAKPVRPGRPQRPKPPEPAREPTPAMEAPEDRLERPARPAGRVPSITEDDFY